MDGLFLSSVEGGGPEWSGREGAIHMSFVHERGYVSSVCGVGKIHQVVGKTPGESMEKGPSSKCHLRSTQPATS